jgi:hypothetical protein
MKISDLIERLQDIMGEEGDIEVTCTGSTLPDDHGKRGLIVGDVFETTVENLIVRQDDKYEGRKRVRLYL